MEQQHFGHENPPGSDSQRSANLVSSVMRRADSRHSSIVPIEQVGQREENFERKQSITYHQREIEPLTKRAAEYMMFS